MTKSKPPGGRPGGSTPPTTMRRWVDDNRSRRSVASREVDWYAVSEFVRPLLRSCPWPGTPAWCELSDHDPAKLAAVLWAGALWALNEDARQHAMAQASRDVSAAADWGAIGRRVCERETFYNEKPWLRKRLA